MELVFRPLYEQVVASQGEPRVDALATRLRGAGSRQVRRHCQPQLHQVVLSRGGKNVELTAEHNVKSFTMCSGNDCGRGRGRGISWT